MLHVKSCNVKHNSESVFRYFASAVNSNWSTKCNRKDLHAICSHWSLQKVGYVPLYTFCKLIVWYTATGLLKSPCVAHQPEWMGFTLCKFSWSGFGIHLITTESIIKRLRLYEFTLWGQDLVSVVCIRESPFYRGSLLKKIYENFVGTLETVRNIEASVLEKCLYREVRLWCSRRKRNPFVVCLRPP